LQRTRKKIEAFKYVDEAINLHISINHNLSNSHFLFIHHHCQNDQFHKRFHHHRVLVKRLWVREEDDRSSKLFETSKRAEHFNSQKSNNNHHLKLQKTNDQTILNSAFFFTQHAQKSRHFSSRFHSRSEKARSLTKKRSRTRFNFHLNERHHIWFERHIRFYFRFSNHDHQQKIVDSVIQRSQI
jgi:hypothetical protein